MHCNTDPQTNTTCDSTDNLLSDTAVLCEHPVYVDEYKSEEDYLWVVLDRREWREYLKTLWLSALGVRYCAHIAECLVCVLYYRRLLISISGWLARKGYNKKN